MPIRDEESEQAAAILRVCDNKEELKTEIKSV